jgi:hypothetical protein
MKQAQKPFWNRFSDLLASIARAETFAGLFQKAIYSPDKVRVSVTVKAQQ